MYVGEDPAGRQLSGIFSGSDTVRKFINNRAIDVHTMMDKYTSIFKCVFLSIYLDLYLMITGVLGMVMAWPLVWMVVVDVWSWPLRWNCSVARGKYLETGIAAYSGV